MAICTILAALFITPPASAEENSIEAVSSPSKCGTGTILLDQASSVRKLAWTRSVMQKSVLSPQGHFRVHYDSTGLHAVPTADANHNGIPDYVDSTLVYLEYAWDIQINQLGFDAPLDDGTEGGGPEMDIYLRQLNQIYGQTWPVNRSGNTAAAYIEIDNNFVESYYSTKGYDALKVTTAHEFFHAVQFRYNCDYSINWWQEHSAVWMEEHCWGDINDYIAYIHYFFDKPDKPLNYRDGSFEYGAAIWAQYLAIRHGDGIIRTIWERIRTLQSDSIADFDPVIPNGLAQALGEFAVWNYCTGDRAKSGRYYPDAAMFTPGITPALTIDDMPGIGEIDLPHLTSRYVVFSCAPEWDVFDSLRIQVTAPTGARISHHLLLRDEGGDDTSIEVTTTMSPVYIDRVWEDAVLVTASTDTEPGTISYAFNSSVQQGETPALRIVSPASGTTIDSGMPVVIQWEFSSQSSSDLTVDLMYSLDGVSYSPLNPFTSLGIAATAESYRWTPDADLAGSIWIRIAASDGSEALHIYTMNNTLPFAFALTGVYPNPFNASASLMISVPRDGGRIRVEAYSIGGQHVGMVFDGVLDGGMRQIIWTPRGLSSGVYFLRVSSPWGTRTARATYLR